MIRIRNNDMILLGKERAGQIDESSLGKDSSVALMYHDPSDHGSLILIRSIPKQNTPF